jgi:hypothetical protein
MTVPDNAYIDYSGNDWRCLDGFRKKDSTCAVDR